MDICHSLCGRSICRSMHAVEHAPGPIVASLAPYFSGDRPPTKREVMSSIMSMFEYVSNDAYFRKPIKNVRSTYQQRLGSTNRQRKLQEMKSLDCSAPGDRRRENPQLLLPNFDLVPCFWTPVPIILLRNCRDPAQRFRTERITSAVLIIGEDVPHTIWVFVLVPFPTFQWSYQSFIGLFVTRTLRCHSGDMTDFSSVFSTSPELPKIPIFFTVLFPFTDRVSFPPLLYSGQITETIFQSQPPS